MLLLNLMSRQSANYLNEVFFYSIETGNGAAVFFLPIKGIFET
jgi:hypothetical protein